MEYIKKQSLLADLNETTPHSYFAFETMVRAYPTEDVAPVVHAHWETDKHVALDFCSSCGEAVERYVTAEQLDKSNKGATYWNYCPHCGAIMDEEVDDE